MISPASALDRQRKEIAEFHSDRLGRGLRCLRHFGDKSVKDSLNYGWWVTSGVRPQGMSPTALTALGCPAFPLPSLAKAPYPLPLLRRSFLCPRPAPTPERPAHGADTDDVGE